MHLCFRKRCEDCRCPQPHSSVADTERGADNQGAVLAQHRQPRPSRHNYRSQPCVEQVLMPCHAAFERARMHDSVLLHSTVAYFEATYKLHSVSLVRKSVLNTVPGKGWPFGQYVYVVYTYTYASVYLSSYLYKPLFNRTLKILYLAARAHVRLL